MSGSEQTEIVKNIVDSIAEGATFKDIKHLSDETFEAVYNIAYSMYQSGKVKKAETLFKFLCLNDHYGLKYFMGLAACQQAQKRYEAAIATYSYALMLDSEEPQLPLQAANCHLALGNYEAAASGYHAAKLFGQKKPGQEKLVEFARVREQAMRLKAKSSTATQNEPQSKTNISS